MNPQKQYGKIGIIIITILIITILHYRSVHGGLGAHIAHRELYFIPILLSSFWFGLKPGIATSMIISIIYAPHVFTGSEPSAGFWPVFFQVLIFNLVALILGYLVERSNRQQKKMIAVERSAVLGLAATAVGHEMKGMLNALKTISNKNVRPGCAEINREFQKELERLEQLTDIIATFNATEPFELLSNDLNEIVTKSIQRHTAIALKNKIAFKISLDEKGCPSRVNQESIGRVFDRIIQNALEASSRGKTIWIASQRKESHCEVSITDQGVGISPENLPKIFKPFFTTKDKRDGLSLSASHKVIRDMGGDITVHSQYGKGATFTVIIPREDSGKDIKGKFDL